MRRALWLLLLGCGALALNVCGANGDDKKGTPVELDGLRSEAPAAWKEEEPANRMRYMQFRLPKVKDDKADAELVIFKGFGGSAKDNIKRWKEQFIPPEGKKIDDVAKVMEMKVAGAELSYLDVRGTYLFKARPIDPDAKAERRPDYRMLAVHFEGPKNVYHIKLVGPAKTIEHHRAGFDDWLKAFK
jgi:hypothetical protein